MGTGAAAAASAAGSSSEFYHTYQIMFSEGMHAMLVMPVQTCLGCNA